MTEKQREVIYASGCMAVCLELTEICVSHPELAGTRLNKELGALVDKYLAQVTEIANKYNTKITP